MTLAGAAGGLVVGAFGKMLGVDAFALLVGRSPGDITGALEGMLLGGAVGASAYFALRSGSVRVGASIAGLCGGLAGIVIGLIGRPLMGGSLDIIARHFPGSRLRLDQLGALFGESGFGPVTRTVTGALEAALFAGAIVAAMMLAKRVGRSGKRVD